MVPSVKHWKIYCKATAYQPVGWVERSDTHQLKFAKMMGFAKGSTHPTSYELDASRSKTT